MKRVILLIIVILALVDIYRHVHPSLESDPFPDICYNGNCK